MNKRSVTRKLTAVFYADVAGYSRLTGDDELGTHHRVMQVLDYATDAIQTRGGRVLRYAGDAVLAEFTSAVTAVNAAADIQKGLHERNKDADEDRMIQLRIGVNLGEVLEDREEIFGEGVNLAARLEAAADLGGVCISSTVWDQVAGKVHIKLVDGGEQSFKNIARPVRVFRWHPGNVPMPRQDYPELPAKPSIAVLPLVNMSADPEQEFFADGITEDIITELSKFRSLFVIARNSSFAFKGRQVDVKEVSSKLGVRYIVEGSVRRAGNRARITAQLVDAIADNHLWAERYDRDLEDIFSVQDEVTEAIVTAIEPQLISVERQRARRKPTASLSAWECYQRGLWHIYQYKAEDTAKALAFLEKAIELDPNFASAHGGIAFSMYVYIVMGNSQDRERDLVRGLEAGKTAVALDENDPFAHVGLGRIHIVRAEHDQAIAAFDRAIALNPSFALAHYGRAHSLWHCGRAAEAVAAHDEAIRLSPRDPLLWTFLASKAIALVMLKRYGEALECSRQAQKFPITAIWAFMGELSALGLLDREDEARHALERALRIQPNLSLAFINQALPITHAPSREHFLSGLTRAGVPD